MSRIDILIAVDVEGALASGSLQTNVYLVDTNKYIGSWNQGQSTLTTACQDGATLVWSVAPVDPGNGVTIAGFSGALIDSGVCSPQSNPIVGGNAWSGLVESQGQFAPFAYAVTLSLGGQSLSFAATVKIV